MATSNFYQMKKVSLRPKLIAYCLSISAYFFLLLLPSLGSVYGELLVQEWGVIPQSAGFIAAESWGIAPKTSGKTIVAFYQNQTATSYIALLEDNQNLLPAIGDIPITPTNELPPGDGMPIVQGFCEIRGEVSDDRLNPIKGVSIELLGSGKTTETDAEGKFYIPAAPSGNITLEASKIGYVDSTQSATALPGQLLTMRISLKVKSADGSSDETMMEEETVVGEFQETTNSGDFNLSINMEAPKLTATMGREEFQKNAVSDAGEAIAKVSGANIVDGKYAVVRGLADRYVTTTFNGAQIASADPSRKAVQLDLFPTSVIETIKVDKTYTTNLPGDFGGGAIDISTRSLPKERIVQITSRVGYNDALDQKTYVHPNRELGIWGDIGSDMPDVLERRNPDGSVTFLDSGNLPADQLSDRWKQLHESQNLKPKEADSQLAFSQSLVYGETFELPNQMKLGLMTAFSRGTADTYNTTPITNQIRTFERDEYSRVAEWTAYISTALQINENNTISATYFNKHLAQDDIVQTRNIIDDEENLNYGIHIPNSGANPANTYGPDYIYYGGAWDINPLARDLEIYQIKGTHALDERGPRFDWAITRSSAVESRPHSTHFEFGKLDFSSAALAPQIAAANMLLASNAVQLAGELGLANPQSFTWSSIKQPMIDSGLGDLYDAIEQSVAIKPDDNRPPVFTSDHGASGSIPGKQLITRRTEKTTENADHRNFNLALPIYFNDTDDDRYCEFGFGASSLFKERITTARAYSLILSSSSSSDPGFTNNALTGPGGLGELIAADPSLINQYFNGGTNGNPYYVNDLVRNGLENISTQLNQVAYFSNMLLRFDKSFINAGVRFEKESYDIDIASNPLSAFTQDQIEGNGWENRDPQSSMLPAINAGTSMFNDRLDFQIGWSQTVARPTFWEFIPSQTTDQTTGLGRRGNNNLGQTDIDNFDLAVTYRPTETSSIRASLFHKNLVRPLVTFFENGTLLYADSFLDQATNARQDFTSTINGIELEADITNMGPFSLRGNFTYIDAQLQYYYVQNGATTSVTSNLPYQPTYLGNINLGYEYEPWKFNANFVYNYNGEYPIILKLTPTDFEVTRDAIHTFDLVLSKVIETDDVNYTFRGGVRNIFNAVDTYMLNNKIYDSTNIGRNYWAEIQLNF